jgi:hypothetical protein
VTVATSDVLATASVGAAYAGDSPGWYYGADGAGPAPAGCPSSCTYPYKNVTVGGVYGEYIGEVGTWTDYLGCTTGALYSQPDAAWANDDLNYYSPGAPGALAYFYAGGPGADPNYNPNASLNSQLVEAYNWGWDQAEYAMDFDEPIAAASQPKGPVHIAFMDIEPDQGWDEIVNCAGTITPSSYQRKRGPCRLQWFLELH